MDDATFAINLINNLRQLEHGKEQFLFEYVQQMMEVLDLPETHCTTCAAKMDFFEYHWNQGYCSECIEKMEF
jgi:hypothetical protein